MKQFLLFCIFQLFLFSVIGQEKRLALVIGNANYDKDDALKNPVNDALLMKETLEKLNFEVILDTNIRTRNDLLNIINLFGEKRKNYSVGFVYYAGHGVQIDGDNYILATKENYASKINVKDNGVNVDRFLEYFELAKNEINILILDACRNNPFEKNWTTSSRSLEDGIGLAPLSSSGNIIAFSTSAGTTSSDGNENEKNSLYCLSLVKNMMTTDLDLDQIFRNVRKEVREISGGNQLPTVDNHYEGSDFYFRKSTYTDQINQIDSLIDSEEYDLALEKVSAVIAKSPNNKRALLRRGRIEYNKYLDYKGDHLFKADSLYPNDSEVLEYLGRYYSTIGEVEKANNTIDRAILLFPNDPNLVYWRARFDWESKNLPDAEKFFTKAITLDSTEQRFLDRVSFYENYPDYYEKAEKDYKTIIELSTNKANAHYIRALFFMDILENNKKALEGLNEAIFLDPTNIDYLDQRGKFYSTKLIDPLKAIGNWIEMLNIDSLNVDAMNSIGLEYIKLGDTISGVKWFNQGIQLENINPNSSAFCYSNRADVYASRGKLDEALIDFSKAVNNSINKSEHFYYRFRFQLDYREDEIAALNDVNEAIRLDPENINYLYDRGNLWVDNLDNEPKAIEDFEKALEIDPNYTDAINAIGTIYTTKGDTLKAIEQFNKGIKQENQNPEAAAFCYGNRAVLYAQQGKLSIAEHDYSKAIELTLFKSDRYYSRALFYFFYKKDLEASIKDLDLAIKLDQVNLTYLIARGTVFRELKKYSKAILDFEEILRIDPNNINAINEIGITYEEQGKIEESIWFYTIGIEKSNLNPTTASYCYSNRGRLLLDQNRFDEALSDFTLAIEFSENKASAYRTRAEYFQSRGEFDRALIDFSLAIENASDDKSLYYYFRAVFYKDYLKNELNAFEDYQKILEIDSTDFDALIGVCGFRISQGEFRQSLEILDKWQTSNEINDSIRTIFYLFKGSLQSAKGNYVEAHKDYDNAIQIDNKKSVPYFERAKFYEYYLNDLEKALIDYSKAIELEPENTDYYLRRSDVFFKLGNYKGQIKDISIVRKIDSKSVDFIGREALVYAMQGDFKKALELSDEAIKMAPSNYMAYLYKAKISIKNKDYSGSQNLLKKIMEMEPNDPEAFFLMGKIYESKGENLNAVYMYSLTENKYTKGTYYITDDLGNALEKSEVYYQFGNFYEKTKVQDLMCGMYSTSLNLINQNQLFRLKDIKNEIQEKLLDCQN